MSRPNLLLAAPTVLVALFWTAGACAGQTAPMTSQLPSDEGLHSATFVASDGFTLRYGLDFPPMMEEGGSRPRPLVLALHYGFDRSKPFPEYYGRAFLERVVRPGLRGLGAFLIAPDSHGRSWSDAELGRAVVELVQAARNRYSIDADQVIVTGFSMGGAGAWHFLSEYPDLFSAGIPMAGFTDEATAKRVRVPVRVLHSVEDNVAPIDPMRRIVETLQANGARVELVELEGISHYQSPRFAPALEASIRWLRRVWGVTDPNAPEW